MSRILYFALELLIVVIAVLLGAEMAQRVHLVPRSILDIPDVYFRASDIRTVLVTFLVTCSAAMLVNRFISGWDPFETPRRAAKEVYAFLTGAVAAALYLFFLTPINFSPEFLLDAFLIGLALLLMAFLAARWIRGRDSPLRQLGAVIGSLFGLLKSPWTWLVILFALTPLMAAYKFTTDRDFGNWVTNLRISSNVGDQYPYAVVNALGDTRFETPIMAQFADGDPHHIYVLERNGRLYRADYPSGGNKILLLDLREGVGYVEMENGALGFDLHPEFGRAGSPNAGFVYVFFTEYHPDRQINRLNRYDLSLPDVAARTASGLPLIAQGRSSNGYHNGGSVEFGPDGFLYLAVGESDMEVCHQRLECALVAGILRIDVDRRGGTISRPIGRQPAGGQTANYYIPLDNPYAGRPDLLGEYWAHGLRNPFRISFDRATGALWAGDVGSAMWEEVNLVERGGNYQFPYVEGREPQQEYRRPARLEGRERPPVLTYHHTALLRSVIGGLVYRGDRIPEARGRYVFLDNYSGQIMTIPASGAQVEDYDIIARTPEVSQRGPTGFTPAPDGELLVVMMGDNDEPTGIVGKLVPAASESARDAAAEQAATKAAAAKESVSAEQASNLFNTNCGRCHGTSGKGDGPDAKLLGAPVPDFTREDFHAGRDDRRLHTAIKAGGAAVGGSEYMPPWEGMLTEPELQAMVRHVRGFRGEAAAGESGH
ncbi:MAG TPA: PQQ-dependent sugar dehydrogenase [Allosphingosinicella sp.]|nr:PQQ-dependent sugar dehydrogenase [Allosphingosinicella sp.]